MDFCDSNVYTLPTIDFVGGETQKIVIHTYSPDGEEPYNVSGYSANFSVVSAMNKSGTPVITKAMDVSQAGEGEGNVLSVCLEPSETVSMSGKYIYQITIMDCDGGVEIPKQGIMMVTGNINKKFITQNIQL